MQKEPKTSSQSANHADLQSSDVSSCAVMKNGKIKILNLQGIPIKLNIVSSRKAPHCSRHVRNSNNQGAAHNISPRCTGWLPSVQGSCVEDCMETVHRNPYTKKWKADDTKNIGANQLCHVNPSTPLSQQAYGHKLNGLACRSNLDSRLERKLMTNCLSTNIYKSSTDNIVKCPANMSTTLAVNKVTNRQKYVKKTSQKCMQKESSSKKKKLKADKQPKMSNEERTQERTNLRRSNVCYKVLHQDPISLTKYEQYDVHLRAEEYVTTVVPHPDFVIASQDRQQEIKEWVENYPTKLSKKKRRRSVNVAEDRAHTESTPQKGSEYSTFVTLGNNGVTLLRPPTKLVELVAEAINDSPDGLLQVQQVYHIIMARYPYFKYMSKDYLISWRSSIRHALYQKWFTKIEFSCEFIKSRGCYWSLNRKVTPKEWKLPLRKYFDQDTERDHNKQESDNTSSLEESKTQGSASSLSNRDTVKDSKNKQNNTENEDDFIGQTTTSSELDPMFSIPAIHYIPGDYEKTGLPHSDRSSDGSQGADSGYCGYQLNYEDEVNIDERPLDLTAQSKRLPSNTSDLPILDLTTGTYRTPNPDNSSVTCTTEEVSPLLDLKDIEWDDPDVDTTMEYEELKEAERACINLLTATTAVGEACWENCGDFNGMQWDVENDNDAQGCWYL